MARRPIEEEMVRSITKTSNGRCYTVTLPVNIIRRWRWKNRQRVQISVDEKRKRIIIEDWEG